MLAHGIYYVPGVMLSNGHTEINKTGLDLWGVFNLWEEKVVRKCHHTRRWGKKGGNRTGRGKEASSLVKILTGWEGGKGCIWGGCESSAPIPLPIPYPMHLFHLGVPELYPLYKLVFVKKRKQEKKKYCQFSTKLWIVEKNRSNWLRRNGHKDGDGIRSGWFQRNQMKLNFRNLVWSPAEAQHLVHI